MGQLLATDTDLLQLSVAPAAIAAIAQADRVAALQSASDTFTGYFGAQYKQPLLQWGQDTRQAVCDVATYRLMGRRGYNPQAANDVQIRQQFEDAMAWGRDVARGLARAADVIDSSVQANVGARAGSPRVTSDNSRGWSQRGGGNSGGTFDGS